MVNAQENISDNQTDESTLEINENLASEPFNNNKLESAISKLSNLNQSETTNESTVNDTNNNSNESEINVPNNDTIIENLSVSEDIINVSENVIVNSEIINDAIINDTSTEETQNNQIETSSETLTANNEITTNVVEEDPVVEEEIINEEYNQGQDVSVGFGVTITIVA